jgi:CDP-diacylglycerol--serine O-phosphatidyltransferase
MGKRVPRHWVLPLFVVTVAFFGLLVSFPFEVLALGTLVFLATIPMGVARYRQLERGAVTEGAPLDAVIPVPPDTDETDGAQRPLH